MKLERDELEREIVTYDKQKLITEVLKIWEVNVRLAGELDRSRTAGIRAMEKIAEHRNRIDELERMTLWQKINQRLEYKIERMKARRTKTFI